jgi:hypothetical protein
MTGPGFVKSRAISDGAPGTGGSGVRVSSVGRNTDAGSQSVMEAFRKGRSNSKLKSLMIVAVSV